jgi:hypothetical protein
MVPELPVTNNGNGSSLNMQKVDSAYSYLHICRYHLGSKTNAPLFALNSVTFVLFDEVPMLVVPIAKPPCMWLNTAVSGSSGGFLQALRLRTMIWCPFIEQQRMLMWANFFQVHSNGRPPRSRSWPASMRLWTFWRGAWRGWAIIIYC